MFAQPGLAGETLTRYLEELVRLVLGNFYHRDGELFPSHISARSKTEIVMVLSLPLAQIANGDCCWEQLYIQY